MNAEHARVRAAVAVDDRHAAAQDHEELRQLVAGLKEQLSLCQRTAAAGRIEHLDQVVAEPRERRVTIEGIFG